MCVNKSSDMTESHQMCQLVIRLLGMSVGHYMSKGCHYVSRFVSRSSDVSLDQMFCHTVIRCLRRSSDV